MPPSAEAVAQTRSKIHEAAIRLIVRRGFHGTSTRDIAKEAGVSLGNLYNHHASKEALFAAILDELEAAYTADDTPLARALARFESLDDLEALGDASRRMVTEFADYIRLIYVDVVEQSGQHVQRLFAGMRKRYEVALGPRLEALRRAGELAQDVDPIAGLMTATIAFFYLFNVEHIFGVERLYGTSDKRAIAEISQVLRRGLLPRESVGAGAGAGAGPGRSAAGAAKRSPASRSPVRVSGAKPAKRVPTAKAKR